MQPANDIRKELDEALRDIDPSGLGMMVRTGMVAPAGFGPAELARWSAAEIRSELAYSHDLVSVGVNGRWVTLQGEVEWNYQKNGAETAVRRGLWVSGITNDLHVQPRTEAGDLERGIEAAIRALGKGDARVLTWAEGERPEPAPAA